jgi:hypothetical protein
MQTLSQAELLGFVELQVGSLAVQVPIRANPTDENEVPMASFAVDGESCAILIKGNTEAPQMKEAVAQVAQEAVRHLSRKLLN